MHDDSTSIIIQPTSPAYGTRHRTPKTHSLRLESLNCFDLGIHVVGHGLELLEELLSLINDGFVLKDSTVVTEVDGGGLVGELSVETLSISMAFPESLQRRDSF